MRRYLGIGIAYNSGVDEGGLVIATLKKSKYERNSGGGK
jgi:hypothetical protein